MPSLPASDIAHPAFPFPGAIQVQPSLYDTRREFSSGRESGFVRGGGSRQRRRSWGRCPYCASRLPARHLPEHCELNSFEGIGGRTQEDLEIRDTSGEIRVAEQSKRWDGYTQGTNSFFSSYSRLTTSPSSTLTITHYLFFSQQICREWAPEKYNLSIYLVDAEYQFDRHKLVLYYSAAR